MIDCEQCERQELPYFWRVITAIVGWHLGAPSVLSGYGSTMRALLGGPPPPTHYELHYAEFIRTGEPIEKERMLRQVK
jgi:hypothetical protein